jgi:hypothetical protein
MAQTQKNPPADDTLILYAELTPAEIRAAQRRQRQGELRRIAPGVLTRLPEQDWPALIARERLRVLAALYPKAVIGPRTAFAGGAPSDDGVIYLTYSSTRKVQLPGLTVQLLDGPAPALGDTPMMGRELYFPSLARLLMENLSISRRTVNKSVGRAAVEQRLIEMCEARGGEALGHLRDQARALAPALGLEREFALLDGLIGGVLGTRKAEMLTVAGKAMVATIPYDANRLALFEKLAEQLRSLPLKQPATVARSERSRTHFAFLESYFSNFIEGTEFDVKDARGFVLEGKPITERPKDSHDIIGVFRQALNPGWANQTLASGEPVLTQLRERHADQMKERPEVGPGEFKTQANRAGNTEFVAPRLVRGTLVESSKLLPTVPPGTARALMAMFVVAEVHPFNDGNGRVARLVMNAELSALNACRIIIPTLFREEYLDCLRVLTREGSPKPFLDAMQHIHEWTAAFDYEDLDKVIADMKACNAFEKSRTFHRLLFPGSYRPSSG